MGRKHTPESIEKMRLSHKGQVRSEEYRRNISKAKIGEKNPMWKGGRTNFRLVLRNTGKYRQWRKSVFERDNYTCQSCFVRGGKIEVHHIKQLAVILDENKIQNILQALGCQEIWGIDNGLTLCRVCHKLTDSYAKNV